MSQSWTWLETLDLDHLTMLFNQGDIYKPIRKDIKYAFTALWTYHHPYAPHWLSPFIEWIQEWDM